MSTELTGLLLLGVCGVGLLGWWRASWRDLHRRDLHHIREMTGEAMRWNRRHLDLQRRVRALRGQLEQADQLSQSGTAGLREMVEALDEVLEEEVQSG